MTETATNKQTYTEKTLASAELYVSRQPVHAQSASGEPLWSRGQMLRAFYAGQLAIIDDEAPPPVDHVAPERAFAKWFNSGPDIAKAAGIEVEIVAFTSEGNMLKLTSAGFPASQLPEERLEGSTILSDLLALIEKMPEYDRGFSWTSSNWQGNEEIRAYGENAAVLKFILDNTKELCAALSGPAPAELSMGLPQDVINLVIAAREFWDVNNDLNPESLALDRALDAFASRVPYENEPDAKLEDQP